VGTGTGILARIACDHGVERVVGTDIDTDALAMARAKVPEALICNEAPDHWGAQFDLVVANILEGALLALAPALLGALAPGGTLLLSGFTPRQVPALKAVFAGASEASLEGWSLLRLEAARKGT
jgi:ribosomal protein L11 methyltransferase